MTLPAFLQGLWTQGQVMVAPKIGTFTKADQVRAVAILEQYYTEDAQEMPGHVPDFSPEPALWATSFLYQATQLVLLRDLDEEVINQQLTPYPTEITPEVIYSVDLTFRFLPDLFDLARGLAPDDALVKKLRDTAIQWPFSSVGMASGANFNTDTIYNHPSLRQAYIDRIVKAKDDQRLTDVRWRELVDQALGNHRLTFWPELANRTK